MPNNTLIAINKYGKYFVPKESQHRPAAQQVLAGKVYEEETIQYIIDNSKGNGIIHAGAYFGDFIPALSSHFTKVYAFEINHTNYNAATKTIEINNLKNVDLSFNALGNQNTTINVLAEPQMGGSSMVNKNGKQQITQVLLDKVINHKIDIIHLDIEGYELNALEGAVNIIQKDKPIVILEDNNNNTSPFMKKMGYSKVGKINFNTVWK